jgi:hypothetical protein
MNRAFDFVRLAEDEAGRPALRSRSKRLPEGLRRMPVCRSAAGAKLVNALKNDRWAGRSTGEVRNLVSAVAFARHDVLEVAPFHVVEVGDHRRGVRDRERVVVGAAFGSAVAAPHGVFALVEVAALHRRAEDQVVGLEFLAHSRIEAPLRAGRTWAVLRRLPELRTVDVGCGEESGPAFAVDPEAVVVVFELRLGRVAERGELALDLTRHGRQRDPELRA